LDYKPLLTLKIAAFSPGVQFFFKSRMRWAGHVSHMGEKRDAYRILVGRPEGRHHLGDPGVDGRIILKWMFKKWDGAWSGLSWLRLGTGGGRL
jgi:hypothetical protein